MNAVTTTEVHEIQAQQRAPQNDTAAVMSLITRAASDPTVDIDKLERLMQLHQTMGAQQAEANFNAAMSRAQSEMAPISADATNPQTASQYATYAKLDRVLRPIYTGHGFALSFDSGDGAPEGHIRIIAHVSHSAGHTRKYKLDMPTDGKGIKGNSMMTQTHAMGSGVTYGQRYLLKMIFNVAIGTDDNDGNAQVSDVARAWADKIESCKTMAELTVVATDLGAVQGVNEKERTELRRAWAAKAKTVGAAK